MLRITTGLLLSFFATIANASQPNFLVVVVDDMGWSDSEPFGGEIHTPTLASLANEGMKMTNFYVAPTCSPTRSMLLTGIDHHLAGLGTMDKLQTENQLNAPGYQGQLLDSVVTIPEALKTVGYQTFLSGKWHLAVDSSQTPDKRGFDQSFTLLEGGASHFSDRKPLHGNYQTQYLENGKPVDLPDDFYSSIHYTDKMLDYLQESNPDTPFFAYLAYTAPHDPLQVPDQWLERYRGKYAEGPESIRQQRLERQTERGLISPDTKLWQAPAVPDWLPIAKPPWHQRSESQQQADARSMEIYAAMIELMDQQLGRIVKYLRDSNRLDNTYIIFLSDNGASGLTPLMYPDTDREWLHTNRDNSQENLGRPGSHLHLGQEWALAANTPWKMYKAMVGEGGIRSPFIVRGPNIKPGSHSNSPSHITSLAPTLFDLAGMDIDQSDVYHGRQKPSSSPLTATWQQQELQSSSVIAFELFGQKAVRLDQWKAHYIDKPMGSGRWELYNLDKDPGETQDLSQEHPQVLTELLSHYQSYHDDKQVIMPIPGRVINLDQLHVGECNFACEAKLYIATQLIKLF